MHIQPEEIKVMVCIALSAIPILKKDLTEVKEACKAKKIEWCVKNMPVIFGKFFLSLLQKVNQLEEALTAKGYSSQ